MKKNVESLSEAFIQESTDITPPVPSFDVDSETEHETESKENFFNARSKVMAHKLRVLLSDPPLLTQQMFCQLTGTDEKMSYDFLQTARTCTLGFGRNSGTTQWMRENLNPAKDIIVVVGGHKSALETNVNSGRGTDQKIKIYSIEEIRQLFTGEERIQGFSRVVISCTEWLSKGDRTLFYHWLHEQAIDEDIQVIHFV